MAKGAGGCVHEVVCGSYMDPWEGLCIECEFVRGMCMYMQPHRPGGC